VNPFKSDLISVQMLFYALHPADETGSIRANSHHEKEK